MQSNISQGWCHTQFDVAEYRGELVLLLKHGDKVLTRGRMQNRSVSRYPREVVVEGPKFLAAGKPEDRSDLRSCATVSRVKRNTG